MKMLHLKYVQLKDLNCIQVQLQPVYNLAGVFYLKLSNFDISCCTFKSLVLSLDQIGLVN